MTYEALSDWDPTYLRASTHMLGGRGGDISIRETLKATLIKVPAVSCIFSIPPFKMAAVIK